jgi:hypothetical protein
MRVHVWFAVFLLCTGAAPCGERPSVIVNGAVLDVRTQRALEARYGAPLQSGRYWYDAVSGLWGLEGGPSLGQIVPGLRLGPLAADASVKARWPRTFVFVNGREIHPRELSYLQELYGSVGAGRYWLNARGIAGYEGGPPQFDLRATAMSRRSQGNAGYGRRGAFGNSASDGHCSYFNDVNSGASVLVGDC